jgi:hypothetical protein
MRAVVVYESMYGNTKTVATAIADGLRTAMEVELVEVGAAPAIIAEDIGLLVVGAPTHAHGLSKPETRQKAAGNASGGLVSPGIGLREWLAGVRGSARVSAAAFDTTIKGPRLLWGSAAEAADRRLRSLGFAVVVPPERFFIKGPFGPVHDVLQDGEVERAQAWGEALAAKVRTHGTPVATA